MEPEIRIAIAKDFSRAPGARYRRHGPHSGEEFLEDILMPALRTAEEMNSKVVVVLDGALGYATSFLEEAFGGLVRNGFTKSAIHARLKFISNEEPDLIDEIWTYIDEA